MKKTLAVIGVLVLLLNIFGLPVYAEQTDLERVIELIENYLNMLYGKEYDAYFQRFRKSDC